MSTWELFKRASVLGFVFIVCWIIIKSLEIGLLATFLNYLFSEH